MEFLGNESACGLQLCQRKTLAQVFFREICKFVKNTILTEHLRENETKGKTNIRKSYLVSLTSMITWSWTPVVLLCPFSSHKTRKATVTTSEADEIILCHLFSRSLKLQVSSYLEPKITDRIPPGTVAYIAKPLKD